MKILFVCQYFYPETFRGNDIAFHLAAQGHEVHVVTGIPNYPAGKFYPGYGFLRKRHETVSGVKVTHLPIFPRGNGKFMLMLNYLSFLVAGWVYMLFHSVFCRYDLVFCQQLSPVTMFAPAVLYKRIRRMLGHEVPLYTWVLDLWPESLSAAGGISNRYVLGFFRKFVAAEYRWSDRILTSSRSFDRSIMEYGDYKDKIVYFPQWGDGEPGTVPGDFVMPDIPAGFRVMFAGAVGEAHGFECVMNAALLTRNHPEIKWVIVGDGRKLDWVRSFVQQHDLSDTVALMGRYPAATMPSFFGNADVMLVSLNDSPLFNLYAPAKISSYMASGKPIVTCLNGEGADVVREAGCGWSVPAGDAQGLADLIVSLSESPAETLAAAGASGRRYYEEHFDKGRCLARLDEMVSKEIPSLSTQMNFRKRGQKSSPDGTAL